MQGIHHSHYTNLAFLAATFPWEFCELPAPCTGSPHHGPLALQVGDCRRRVQTQIRACPSLRPRCAPRDDGKAGCEGQHITVRLLLPGWEGVRPTGPPCSVHHTCPSTPLYTPGTCPCPGQVCSMSPVVLGKHCTSRRRHPGGSRAGQRCAWLQEPN